MFLAGLLDPKIVFWKERQHNEDDATTARYVGCLGALRDCGLLKFFRNPSMVSHPRLLEHILHMWNPKSCFDHRDRGNLLLDRVVQMRGSHFSYWFPRRGRNCSGADQLSLSAWHKNVK